MTASPPNADAAISHGSDIFFLRPRLTPGGDLALDIAPDGQRLDTKSALRLRQAFAKSSGSGLLQLGANEIATQLSPTLAWWRGFGQNYVASLCHHAAESSAEFPKIPPPNAAEFAGLVLTAPLMQGAEYLTAKALEQLWRGLATATETAFHAAGTDLQTFLKTLDPAWNLVGRVTFNLAENRRDPDFPFAFMATYTTQLSREGRAQHLPLGQALRDSAGGTDRTRLLSLLPQVQRAAERLSWLRSMVELGEIYHPLRWTPREAARLLADAPVLDAAGVVVRMPPAWRASRPLRPQVSAKIGSKTPSAFGPGGLLDFAVKVTLDGDDLTEDEVEALLAGTESLMLLRGQWVEVDRTRLDRALQTFKAAEALAEREGLGFADAMRLLAGASLTDPQHAAETADWSQVSAGPFLADTLAKLRAPDGAQLQLGEGLQGVLRPYQKDGVQWLHLLSSLGLGACLADDMGLGKTMQILALLLMQRGQAGKQPSLLVAPASLLANWAGEIARFAPSLSFTILHASAMPAEAVKKFSADDAQDFDLVITSYAALLRLPALASTNWRFVILDEAQAIKNAAAKQTLATKALRANARIALTGTPVENHLGDLWSIFDFINPGLLGSAKQFSAYTKKLAEIEKNPYGPLRALVRPYILRRMKTDRSVIADLPDKTELRAYCTLSRKQAALYTQAVEGLADKLETAVGIGRNGLVLAAMTRLKQICNHPSHWLGDGVWAEAESGKWARLREIAETAASRQEKMLVFTQFREMTAPLATFLAGIFGREGLVLHGDTKIADRRALVTRFQADESVPFFVLSLKAGGSGLTLTAASHVVHVDRWWNPAVENQATDRAYRIGQKKNVLVHKFVCRGTIEEKIDAMIESKKSISGDLLSESGEINVTRMTNDELLRLVALDLRAATME